MWSKHMGGMSMMNEKMMEMMSKERYDDDVCYENG